MFTQTAYPAHHRRGSAILDCALVFIHSCVSIGGTRASYIEDRKEFYQRILNLLEHHLSSNTEIVLHDLKSPFDRTIIDIRNGHITGRKVGDCITNLGLEVVQGTKENGDYYNYITYVKPSNTLRSLTMHIQDENGEVVGAICINTDITETIKLEEFLKSYNNCTGKQESSVANEVYPDNI